MTIIACKDRDASHCACTAIFLLSVDTKVGCYSTQSLPYSLSNISTFDIVDFCWLIGFFITTFSTKKVWQWPRNQDCPSSAQLQGTWTDPRIRVQFFPRHKQTQLLDVAYLEAAYGTANCLYIVVFDGYYNVFGGYVECSFRGCCSLLHCWWCRLGSFSSSTCRCCCCWLLMLLLVFCLVLLLMPSEVLPQTLMDLAICR